MQCRVHSQPSNPGIDQASHSHPLGVLCHSTIFQHAIPSLTAPCSLFLWVDARINPSVLSCRHSVPPIHLDDLALADPSSHLIPAQGDTRENRVIHRLVSTGYFHVQRQASHERRGIRRGQARRLEPECRVSRSHRSIPVLLCCCIAVPRTIVYID